MRKKTHGRTRSVDSAFESFLARTSLSAVEQEIARGAYYVDYRHRRPLGPTSDEQRSRAACAVDRFCRELLTRRKKS